MDTLYGGLPGTPFIIKARFESVEEMKNAFAQGNAYTACYFGECCIIDSKNKNNPANGRIYKRTYLGAEYVAQIVGPAGTNPNMGFTSIGGLRKIVDERSNDDKDFILFPTKFDNEAKPINFNWIDYDGDGSLDYRDYALKGKDLGLGRFSLENDSLVPAKQEVENLPVYRTVCGSIYTEDSGYEIPKFEDETLNFEKEYYKIVVFRNLDASIEDNNDYTKLYWDSNEENFVSVEKQGEENYTFDKGYYPIVTQKDNSVYYLLFPGEDDKYFTQEIFSITIDENNGEITFSFEDDIFMNKLLPLLQGENKKYDFIYKQLTNFEYGCYTYAEKSNESWEDLMSTEDQETLAAINDYMLGEEEEKNPEALIFYEMNDHGELTGEFTTEETTTVYHGSIEWSWCNIRYADEDDDTSAWTYIGFQIPVPSFDFTTEIVGSYDVETGNRIDSISATSNYKNFSEENPFVHSYDIKVPRGLRGLNISNIQIEKIPEDNNEDDENSLHLYDPNSIKYNIDGIFDENEIREINVEPYKGKHIWTFDVTVCDENIYEPKIYKCFLSVKQDMGTWCSLVVEYGDILSKIDERMLDEPLSMTGYDFLDYLNNNKELFEGYKEGIICYSGPVNSNDEYDETTGRTFFYGYSTIQNEWIMLKHVNDSPKSELLEPTSSLFTPWDLGNLNIIDLAFYGADYDVFITTEEAIEAAQEEGWTFKDWDGKEPLRNRPAEDTTGHIVIIWPKQVKTVINWNQYSESGYEYNKNKGMLYLS